MSLVGRQTMGNVSCLVVTVSALAIGSAPGHTAIIQFTDRAAWEAAVGDYFTEDFNAIAPSRLQNNTTTSVGLLDIETLVPTGSTGFTRITDGSSTSTKNIDGTNVLNLQLDGTPKSLMSFEFSAPTFAWGVDYSFTGFGDPAEVSFADWTTTFGGKNQSGFIGFISDTAFTSVDFKNPHISFAALGLDNVSFSQLNSSEATSVPEPSTLLGSFLILVLGGALKRQGLSKS